MKVGKVIRNVVIILVALVLLVLVTLQVLLRPKVLTGIVNNLAAEYVEGDVNFKEIRAHVIKSFPYVSVDAQDFSITYPHQRYARYDNVYTEKTRRRFSLLKAGWGEEVDTLVAFRKLSVSLNYMAFLNQNLIHVHHLELAHPRIFAHYYDSTAANWDILPIGGGDEKAPEDTVVKEKKPLPGIKLESISLTDRPFIVFTNPADTLHGMITMRRMVLRGTLETEQLFKSQLQLAIDSMMISGRLPSDTLALRLQQLRARAADRRFTLDADASVSLRTGDYGRVRLPVHLDADAELPEREPGELEALINSLNLSLSSLNLEGKGNLLKHKDGIISVDLTAAVRDCPIGQLAREFQDNIPALKGLPTDAIMASISAQAKGDWGNGKKPMVDASVDKLLVDVWGSHIQATGGAKDLLGKDPLFNLNASFRARVDSLTDVFTRKMGITGTGRLDGEVKGRARLSQLNMAKIGNANLSADIAAYDLDIRGDSLNALVPRLALNLESKGNTIDKNIKEGARVLALKADADTLSVSLKDMFVRSGPLQLLAQNSAEILKGSNNMTPMMGILKVSSLRLRDSDGMGISLRDNVETIRVEPPTEGRPNPKLTIRSKTGRARGRLASNMVGLRDLKLDVSATRHTRRRLSEERRNRMLDSLQRVYPDVPRDSLMRHSLRNRLAQQNQDVFAAKDVKISLSDAVKGYARDWDIEGNIGLESGRLFLPAFPLRTSVSAVKGSFDNDTLDLKNITVVAGESDLSARACLSGLRRAMLGRGRSRLKLKADVTSNYIDANELMRAYAYSTTYKPERGLSQASDEAVEAAVEHVELPDSTASKLLVVPSNLEVAFTLEAAGIKYDSLQVSWAAADVAMRDRTLQVTNAIAASNMGDIYFEGFYTTRSLEEIKAGFDLNLVDITAEKVITLFPAVDTLMPLLTTFVGDLDCEMAATTQLDTMMNIVLPSVDGIIKISGKDLGLKESPELTKIARLLMFRNKKEARIDNMSVSGVVQNNILEIFPFVLDVDRYQMAAAGTQHLSQEFDYHVSVIKSPLIIKFGLNAWGPDFSDIHYSLGKAKFRSANVPVYTKELNTVQYNLIGAIHNIFDAGVEKALEENRTGAYFGEVSMGETPAQEDFQAETLQGMEVFLTDVLEQSATRREALKEEVIRLETEAAKKNE